VQEMHEGGKEENGKKKEELKESSRGVWEKGVGRRTGLRTQEPILS
jgi:hypothetical protein